MSLARGMDITIISGSVEFSSEVRQRIAEGFIDIFTRITNKEYQKRIWIRGKGPEAHIAIDKFIYRE